MVRRYAPPMRGHVLRQRRAGSETYAFTAQRFTFSFTKRCRIAYGYVNVNGHEGMESKSRPLSGLDIDAGIDFDVEAFAAAEAPAGARACAGKPQNIAVVGSPARRT